MKIPSGIEGYIQSGKLDKALQKCEEQLKTEPNNYWMYIVL